ncbi:MAG: tetratricopeptide repeat protein [Saprospiraceae bacterium]|nr:tetratricopeptide repeat protein [Saprospiraceae bacterium]
MNYLKIYSKLFLISIYYLCIFKHPLHSQYPMQQKLDSLVNLVNSEKDPKTKASLLNKIAFGYAEVDPQKIYEYGQKALSIAEEYQLIDEMASAHNHLGIYHMLVGDYQKAELEYHKSNDYCEQSGDLKGLANGYGNLGIMNHSLGKFVPALEYFFKSLKISEELGIQQGIANQNLAIANIYMEQGDFEKAIHYDSIAMQHFQELGDFDGVGLIYGNLANIYSDQNKQKEALEAYQKAILIYEKLGNESSVARNLSNMSTIYMDLGDHQKALTLLEQALPKVENAQNFDWICNINGNIGITYLLSYTKYHSQDSNLKLIPGQRGDLYKKGIKYLITSVEMALKIEDWKRMNMFSEKLADAYATVGDFNNAYKYHKLHIQAKDSLHSIDVKSEIERLTTEREVQLKDKQIELDRLAVEKKRNERLYFGIGMGLLFLTSLLIYRNYANQKKSNVQLASLNEQIAESNLLLEDKNVQLTHTLTNLKNTQNQLIDSEKQREKALVRSRISQDIHDDISSGLTKISWLAESFHAKAHNSGLDLKPLEKLTAQARATVNNLGEIIWSSNPERDNLDSLLQYMSKHIADYMDGAPMKYSIDFPVPVPDISLDPDVRRNLYLSLKEALHNARKYSKANKIEISFKLNNNQFLFEISDDGIGIESGGAQGGGNGLHNLKRRMEAIGGQFELHSELGKGVRMVFTGLVSS